MLAARMDQLTCILKFVVVGDAAVGKSCILIRLTDDRFGATESTLGVEFGARVLNCTVGETVKRVKVQCWDTAGTESFRSITRSYFRGAAGALLVYDVTRRETFEHVTAWLDDLREHAEENVSIILVANKTDLCANEPTQVPQIEFGEAVHVVPPAPATDGAGKPLRPRAVTTLEGALFAKQHGLLYVETSAKEGWGVVDAFERTARQILGRVQSGEFERRKPGGIKLGEGEVRTRAGGCC